MSVCTLSFDNVGLGDYGVGVVCGGGRPFYTTEEDPLPTYLQETRTLPTYCQYCGSHGNQRGDHMAGSHNRSYGGNEITKFM